MNVSDEKDNSNFLLSLCKNYLLFKQQISIIFFSFNFFILGVLGFWGFGVFVY